MSFEASVQDVYQRWWFGGIVLPVFLGATVGALISIYTNWVTSRLMLFRQEIQRAREHTLGFIETYRLAMKNKDQSEAETRFQWVLLLPVISLQRQQGQYLAGWAVHRIGIVLEEGANRSWRRLNAVGETTAAFGVIDDETNKLRDAVLDALNRLNRIKPDYWRLGGLPTFGRSWRRAFYRYLRLRVRLRRAVRDLSGDDNH